MGTIELSGQRSRAEVHDVSTLSPTPLRSGAALRNIKCRTYRGTEGVGVDALMDMLACKGGSGNVPEDAQNRFEKKKTPSSSDHEN